MQRSTARICSVRGSFVVTGAVLLIAAACAPQTYTREAGGEVDLEPLPSAQSMTVEAIVTSWPAKQREASAMLIEKYGQPDAIDERMLVWHNKGPFVKIALHRDEQQHNFPMAHPDFLTSTVKYRVPADKVDDLFEYDGSVWVHRTRGEMSAQCDVEEMNYLALNLAHDIATGKRTVQDARAFYAKTAMAFKAGDRSSPYITGLTFEPMPNAADPDSPFQM